MKSAIERGTDLHRQFENQLTTNIRKAFEVWAAENMLHLEKFMSRSEPYVSRETELAWHAWVSAWAQGYNSAHPFTEFHLEDEA